MRSRRLPRRLHGGAWWLWAIGLGAAASRTTNPILLGMILAVLALVVAARRTSDRWAGAFRGYLILALVVILIRVAFRILLGGGLGDHVLFSIPRLPLPGWAAGVVVGGPVTAESILAAFYDGLRLATIVVCMGAANSLADPRRMLRSLPRALYDVGAATVVALSLAPQIVESIGRVRGARRLRGNAGRGLASLRSLITPVLEDAMNRSLALAAAMDTRGFGRLGRSSPGRRRQGGGLALLGLTAMSIGAFGLVGGAMSVPVGSLTLAAGIGAGLAAMVIAGRAVGRTIYRPDRWGLEGWVVAGSGLAVAAVVWTMGALSPLAIAPPLQPLGWPTLPALAVVGILTGCWPAWISPPVPLRSPGQASLAGEEAML